jgi:hypothetical protein
MPNIITLLHDPSWRVRYCAANSVNDLAEAFGQEVTRCLPSVPPVLLKYGKLGSTVGLERSDACVLHFWPS